MGFGWLFLGYVVSFLLSAVGAMLNIKFLVCLLGYVLILRGVWELCKYNQAFRAPLAVVLLLIPVTVYEMLAEWGGVFAWNLPFLSERAEAVMGWVDFALTVIFHFAGYYAIAVIAKSVDLSRTVQSAVFDSVIGVGYVTLLLICRLILSESAAAYFSAPLTAFLLFWRICDVCLLASCCKNICPAGDEDVAPRRYRLEFLNRMGDAFANNFRRAADSTRQSREEALRNRQNRQNRKKRK